MPVSTIVEVLPAISTFTLFDTRFLGSQLG